MYTRKEILNAIEQSLTTDEKNIIYDRLGVNNPPLKLSDLYRKYNLNYNQLLKIEAKILRYLKNQL